MINISCSSVKFYNIILNHVTLSNTFIRINHKGYVLDFSDIQIFDCNFVNFLFI